MAHDEFYPKWKWDNNGWSIASKPKAQNPNKQYFQDMKILFWISSCRSLD